MFELLSITVVWRVPDAREYGPRDLGRDSEESPVQGFFNDVAACVEAPRVLRIAPARGGIHRKPLPLLEGKPNLRHKVGSHQTQVLLDQRTGSFVFAIAQDIHELAGN